ncbi:autotransporter beta-domain protein [Desulfovibrio ferrophilus]|uniref:Autotransporter beta-domain protein n=2 Tax=Desulfovibrio ferrophilus TaxID=241368 RepID=A0A2Z6AYG2_9BACT|nr:autotransporter beta-domain protein [Desulfovibrio ferrophilus]
MLIDQEWEPSPDDEFPDLPSYNDPKADFAPQTAVQEQGNMRIMEDTDFLDPPNLPPPIEPSTKSIQDAPKPSAQQVPDEPVISQPKPERIRPAEVGRVIVSGSLPWENTESLQLEDAMFRLGVSDDIAEQILTPTNDMKQRDRDFITKEARKTIDESKKDKNPTTAFVLSLLLPGVGNVYAGAVAAGFAFIIPAMICIVATVLGALPISKTAAGYAVGALASALCAATTATATNNRLRQQQEGKPERPRETTFAPLKKSNH